MFPPSSLEFDLNVAITQSHRTESEALAGLVQAAVGVLFGVPPDHQLAPSRCCARTSEARQVAIYLSHVVFGMTHSELGRVFGRDRTTCSYACHVIEDKRDDRAFDARLALLEDALKPFAPLKSKTV